MPRLVALEHAVAKLNSISDDRLLRWVQKAVWRRRAGSSANIPDCHGVKRHTLFQDLETGSAGMTWWSQKWTATNLGAHVQVCLHDWMSMRLTMHGIIMTTNLVTFEIDLQNLKLTYTFAEFFGRFHKFYSEGH